MARLIVIIITVVIITVIIIVIIIIIIIRACKTSQNTYLPEHLSMAASVCVETTLSKLLRVFFKDVLVRNQNRKEHENEKFFIVHCTIFRGILELIFSYFSKM